MLSCSESKSDEANKNRDTVSAHSVTARQKTYTGHKMVCWLGPAILGGDFI